MNQRQYLEYNLINAFQQQPQQKKHQKPLCTSQRNYSKRDNLFESNVCIRIGGVSDALLAYPLLNQSSSSSSSGTLLFGAVFGLARCRCLRFIIICPMFLQLLWTVSMPIVLNVQYKFLNVYNVFRKIKSEGAKSVYSIKMSVFI